MIMMRARVMAVLAGALLVLAACAGGSDVQEQLDEVTQQRDALQAQVDEQAGQRERSLEVQQRELAILADPASVGTEEDVAAALGELATPEALMDDDVFGAIGIQEGWFNTLYADDMDSTVEVLHTWMGPDGAQGGTVWVWKGENMLGRPFSLIGVSIVDHDSDGRITNELVVYPYDDAFVERAVMGSGTPTSETGVPWKR